MMLTWSLSIATLNRHDVLLRTLRHALGQTRPPSEIVVVDASDNWTEGREAADTLVAEYPATRLHYIQSPVRSSSEQRNIAIRESTSDVVFLIDDDSFMFPDCAAQVMAVYDTDTAGKVAAVAATVVDEMPGEEGAPAAPIARKAKPGLRARLEGAVTSTAVGRWINRAVLMQNVGELFICYDEPRDRSLPDAVADMDVRSANFIGGVVLTVRRSVALAEPFDSALRYYAAFEDLDATYRYAQHGALLIVPQARLHHFEAAHGRVKRKTVMVFQLLNMVVFLKRHADRPDQFRSRYRRMIYRRLFAELIKDTLSGRGSFPQVRGVLLARRMWPEIWALKPHEIDEMYPAIQKRVLEEL